MVLMPVLLENPPDMARVEDVWRGAGPETAHSYFGMSTRGSGLAAGPLITSPAGVNREPWQGQSQTLSWSFHPTSQA
jgi:hypothetical protein